MGAALLLSLPNLACISGDTEAAIMGFGQVASLSLATATEVN
jgi:hypothetical protein